jgi:hypothetical protein
LGATAIDHQHVLVDMRHWAVLQFAGGVGLSVDVADFLVHVLVASTAA